ncbi:MAG: hypothetical protein GWP06_11110 [Actinobacteria bacterium]|nr:hypothetical protein [Actinomycetota bacterium]
MSKKYVLVLLAFLAVTVLILVQCTEKYPAATKELNLASDNGCVNCHLDAEKLKKVATPLPPSNSNAGEGCGGAVSPLEAWQLVLVKSSFLNSTHGALGCTACHLGNPQANDKEAAHEGLVAMPSDSVDHFCSSCHANIVVSYKNSLHANLKGYYTEIEKRLGYDISSDPSVARNFNKECAKCHASCGQCHVIRPVSVNGGFIDGHNFNKEPSSRDNCTACHGSRVGAEYFGENEGITGDVHWSAQLMRCTTCHTAEAMHSSSPMAKNRYTDTDMVRCEDCHADKKTANIFHSMHWGQLSCQVCHSQPYKNCNSCHTGGEGITGSSYITFKIAKNPIKSPERNYEYVPVRHIPIARNTFASWGIPDLPNYNAEPTWKYATPHNIQRWTAQTDTTGSAWCGAKCHNSDYWLTLEDLAPDEVEANKDIVLTK